ncbi:neutral/alkaline non-lysosomal ceramidase N-terminal domain-containing protein [Fodinibius sediminis]|nr:neutral/alkaline non-lysosomal ceramidase N-terminal domain-containing protein [Fodinibius sediminis]
MALLKIHILSLPLLLVIGLPVMLCAQNNEPAGATELQLKVGIAKADITPDTNIKNWVTGEKYGKVRDALYVRALVMSQGSEKVVLLQWDLVDAGESSVYRVRTAIAEALGIAANHILVNASHNHSAPWAPVYDDQHRGKERDTWWAVRYMPPQNDDPSFKRWMDRLIDQSVEAALRAAQQLQPASLWIGRADVSAYLRNRRPRPVTHGIRESDLPDNFNYRHEDWNPNILSGDKTFGPVDRAMTLISFRDSSGQSIANIFHMACHAVSIYPFMESISADWPGETMRRMNNQMGGESLFLQGTAGDINPWRRGTDAVNKMAEGLTDYAQTVYDYSAELKPGPLKTHQTHVGLPLTDYGRERTGLAVMPSEIQVVAYGSLAIVTLPGEPMTELGVAIKRQSPYPQTLVLGYSNGNGVHYVGMPGEKARGGYETGRKTNIGTDRAGQIMVDAAVDLLVQSYNENRKL